ncbi:unnamed protein product [Mytilus edulis]|uniref:Uncharacterized protein n=1 Tax=Mytilus edulis TaxID=6550 RepID=A0A8S3VG34_MYTED|nr:unnamed protein product [Mytilus edulis]
MYDIDMKNAYPTLLSWYCYDNGINCTGLDAYIANREEYMADWMMRTGNARDEVKAHLLAIINGSKVKLEPEDPEFLENKALMTAFDYLTEQGIEVGSLVFDGLMIYKDNVSSERLSEILARCSQKVMGCDITFTNKVMDEGYYITKDKSSKSVRGNFHEHYKLL